MQSQSDRELQWNVMNFKKTLKGKTTWEDFEEYVGHKIDKGDKLKGFFLNYFNRDFEQSYDDDGQQYITTQSVCTWKDTVGYLKALNRADYYKANKETILKRNAAYREANKEVISKRNAAYHEANKEVISKRNAAYYEANKEVISKRQADYYEANKETILKRNAAYREDISKKSRT